ncbi:hypothetical protein EVAR_49467_1 [Eumeta japonica]|uniref:Uncharacterized protein n=1 Tax=Eumeta variegata TaxID=151549 RepID=A0A4C1Y1V1_EUMVA|nr:hypothetical protein EVAR_49467_1 [Eumeta japonica]
MRLKRTVLVASSHKVLFRMLARPAGAFIIEAHEGLETVQEHPARASAGVTRRRSRRAPADSRVHCVR